MRPRLAVTVGDPRGIGPEIVRAALADPRVGERCELLVVGPEGAGVPVQHAVGLWEPGGGDAEAGRLAGEAIVAAVSAAGARTVAGLVTAPIDKAALLAGGDAEAGRLAGEAIVAAVRAAGARTVAGLVTAPIDKAALLAGGFSHPGHTEMLAALTHSRVAMMLTSSGPTAGGHPLRVVLATTHMPLRAAPDAVTAEVITEIASIAREYLEHWFGVRRPRIALCALNPHAGDRGRFGDEDDRVLRPGAERAGIAGPFPADTVFVRAMRGEFDAVIAPYHDIGMAAIKVAAFGSAVNVTLGLPFPRTSPDHGTAFDIAGRGVADPASFIAATLLCAELALRAAPRAGRPSYGDPPPATRSGARP